jgi:hypothetical protein
MGRFTLHASLDPFRLSWLHDGKLLVAQRVRQRSSGLEVLDDGGWHALTKVIGHREASSEAGPVRLTFEARADAGRKVEVEVSWRSGEPGPLVAICPEGEARAVRDDLVSFPDESFLPVPWSRPLHPGDPLRLSSARKVASSSSPEASLRQQGLLFSSRGYGLLVQAAKAAEQVTFLAPDPDTLRLQSTGPRLQYRILPGRPKEVLQGCSLSREKALQEKAPKEKAGPEEPVLIQDWTALRGWVDSALVGSLLSQSYPLHISVQPKEGEKEEAARELARRVFQAAALLPHLQIIGPPSFSPSEEWLKSIAERLGGAPKRAELLFVEFPLDPEAWKIGNEWLIDGRFLVAPILEEGKLGREVYFPEGAWTDLGAKESAKGSPKGSNRAPVRGPARVTVEIPLGGVGLFERGGAR